MKTVIKRDNNTMLLRLMIQELSCDSATHLYWLTTLLCRWKLRQLTTTGYNNGTMPATQ